MIRKALALILVSAMTLPLTAPTASAGKRCDDDRRYRYEGRRYHRPPLRERYVVYTAPVRRYPAPYVVGGGREFLGNLIGGAAGGVAGSHVGRGNGRVGAIIGGTVLGAMIGGSIGRTMDEVDHWRVAQALEEVPVRRTVTWTNPDTQSRYAVTPIKTYQGQGGRYCREFQTEATVGGKLREVYGTACRQPDGSWEIVN
jgi:surface antigen